MIKHEEKICPACKRKFECKPGSILICQCTGVNLNDAEREYIRAKHEDCLCASCMNSLRADYHNQQLKQKIRKLLGFFETENK